MVPFFILVAKYILIVIVDWMEVNSVVSAGLFTILGAILSAIFNLRQKAINTFNLTENKIKKIKFFAIILGNHNIVNQSSGGGEKPPQSNMLLKYSGPLNEKQKEYCKKVKELSAIHSRTIDIQLQYEESVRSLTANDEIYLSGGRFVQLFGIIRDGLQGVSEKKNAQEEMNQFVIVAEGLFNMIKNKEGKENIKRQINSCEDSLWLLLIKLPL